MFILLDEKKRGNKHILGKKTSFEDVFLIFLLHNSSKNTFLILTLHSLIVSSSFCFLVVKSNINIFSNNNIRKSEENNPETKAQGDTNRKNNLGIEIDINKKIKAENPDIKTDVNAKTNRKIGINNLGIRIDANIRVNNLNKVTSNKICITSFFFLCYTFFLLIFFF